MSNEVTVVNPTDSRLDDAISKLERSKMYVEVSPTIANRVIDEVIEVLEEIKKNPGGSES